MAKSLNIQDFFKQFPDDDACLDHLFHTRYGAEPACEKCGEIGAFHRLSNIPAYTCNCGHHIHPMAGTPFERSRTPLQKWYYAMFLYTTTRNGVSAKEIQRQLGVTYKCAWRIAHKIREYMGWVDGDAPLGGPGRKPVEADKAFTQTISRRSGSGLKRPSRERMFGCRKNTCPNISASLSFASIFGRTVT